MIKSLVLVGTVLLTLPVWFFLLYSLLTAIHPDRLVWFMFWLYIPLRFSLEILAAIVQASEKKGSA
jgi:hypothetical protein